MKALAAVVAAGIVFAWMNFVVGAKIVEGSIGAAVALALVGGLLFLDRIAAGLSKDKIAFAGIGILGGLAAAYFLAGLLTGDMQLFLPAFAVVFTSAIKARSRVASESGCTRTLRCPPQSSTF